MALLHLEGGQIVHKRKKRQMKRYESLLIAIVVGILSFLIFRFLLVDCTEIWGTVESVLGPFRGLMQFPAFVISILSLFSLITALLVYQFCSGRIYSLFAYCVTAFYSLIVFAIIMLKSRGISGFNFNPLQIAQELLQTPITVLFNILLFIPIGFVTAWKHHSLKTGTLFFVIFITVCELAQGFFHLGIFDVDDILLNTFGFCFGFLLQNHAHSHGWTAHKEGKTIIVSKKSPASEIRGTQS